MICRNNGPELDNILSDAAGCGVTEIVLVDTEPGGSQDGTKEIAKRHGAKLLYFPWIDDFAAARNFAYENTNGDWIMWLDTDDRIDFESQQGIKDLMESDKLEEFNSVYLYYNLFKGEKVVSTYPRERIVRRSEYKEGNRWTGRVHECYTSPLPSARTNYVIEHRPAKTKWHEPGRNLKILTSMYEDNNDREPRTLFYYARELYWKGEYVKAIKLYNDWLDTGPIYWERYSGSIELANCHKFLGDEEKYIEVLMGVISLIPERSEAWNAVGHYYYERKMWEKAVPFFRAGAGLPKPEDGFIDEQSYGTLPFDNLATSLGWSGNIMEAKRITQDILIPNAPADQRLYDNLVWYNKVLSGWQDTEEEILTE